METYCGITALIVALGGKNYSIWSESLAHYSIRFEMKKKTLFAQHKYILLIASYLSTIIISWIMENVNDKFIS